jgi:hypothetical protein
MYKVQSVNKGQKTCARAKAKQVRVVHGAFSVAMPARAASATRSMGGA